MCLKSQIAESAGKTGLDRLELQLKTLQTELDFGNQERRAVIAEEINDLRRERDRIKRGYSELTAATAVNLMNFKNRIDAVVEDFKD